MPQHRRALNLAGAVACFALLTFAYYAQYVLHLEPCPLCMLQRLTMFGLGLCFLAAALQHPRGWGRFVYALLIGLCTLATVGVAARHLYIQSQPPGSIPACGAPIEVLLQMFPVTDVIRKVLHGGGECALVSWSFLGLAMPAWVLLWAVVLGVGGVLNNVWAAPARDRAPRFASR
jgi:disulfide bond formation protein DsbB